MNASEKLTTIGIHFGAPVLPGGELVLPGGGIDPANALAFMFFARTLVPLLRATSGCDVFGCAGAFANGLIIVEVRERNKALRAISEWIPSEWKPYAEVAWFDKAEVVWRGSQDFSRWLSSNSSNSRQAMVDASIAESNAKMEAIAKSQRSGANE